MNNTSKMCVVLLLAALGAGSCGEGTGERIETHADSIASKIETGMDNLGDRVDSMRNGSGNADQDFLEDAVELNTMEMRMLMLGQQKGSKDVKAHASHMLADHKKMATTVTTYLKNKNLTIDPDTTDRDTDFRDRQAGADFDRAFADRMVSDHEKTIRVFEDAQDDVKDPELKTMISTTLPKLRAHLDMSREMQNKLNRGSENTNTGTNR